MPLMSRHFPVCFPARQGACLGSQFRINVTSVPLGQLCPRVNTHNQSRCFCSVSEASWTSQVLTVPVVLLHKVLLPRGSKGPEKSEIPAS